MNDIQRQRGITMWGMIFILAVLGFSLFITFKLFPVYMNDLKVSNALKSVGTEMRGGASSREAIIDALAKRWAIDEFSHVDFNKDITIQSKGTGREVRIAYEVVVPLFGNLAILVNFDHSTYISGGG